MTHTLSTPANPVQGVSEKNAPWTTLLEQLADSSFVSEARAATLREIAEHLRSLAAIGAGGQAVAGPGLFAERVVAACRAYMNTYDVLADEVREHMQVNMADALRASDALSQPHPADERVEPTDGVSNKAEEGRQAYKSGQSKDSNPYRQGTARYWQWSSGWLDERAFRPRTDERVVEALPRPDGVSMTCGTICLEYIDRDERDLAYDWLEAHGAGAAKEGR
jgi:hypothetical protein